MNEKAKKNIGVIIGTIVGVAISTLIVQQFFKKDIESELKKVVVELNKKAPIQVDEEVMLDSVSSKGQTKIIYHYSLFQYEKSEVNLDTVNKYIRPAIIEKVKNSPDLKVFRDNNITMDYEYYDKDGEFVIKISVTPDIYKN